MVLGNPPVGASIGKPLKQIQVFALWLVTPSWKKLVLREPRGQGRNNLRYTQLFVLISFFNFNPKPHLSDDDDDPT